MIGKANLEKKEKGTYISVPLVPRVEQKTRFSQKRSFYSTRSPKLLWQKGTLHSLFYARGNAKRYNYETNRKAETKVNIVTKVKNKRTKIGSLASVLHTVSARDFLRIELIFGRLMRPSFSRNNVAKLLRGIFGKPLKKKKNSAFFRFCPKSAFTLACSRLRDSGERNQCEVGRGKKLKACRMEVQSSLDQTFARPPYHFSFVLKIFGSCRN